MKNISKIDSSLYAVCFILFFVFCFFSDISLAADLEAKKDNLITEIHQGYVQSASAFAAVFKDLALNLFWWLVRIDLLFNLIMFWKDGDRELPQLVSMLFYRIVYAGFFLLILNYGMKVANFIYDVVVNDFATRMIDAGMGHVDWLAGPKQVSPPDFLDIGFSICFAITEKASFWSATGLTIGLVAILIMICFLFIVAELLVAMIEFYLVASIGYFLLAFGGLQQTRNIVFNYFKTLFAIAFKIMCVYAVTSIAFGFIKLYAGTEAQQTSIVQDTETLLVLLASVALFAILAKSVPDKITGIITGAVFAGGVNAGAGSMVKNMVAGAAGGAVATAAATGTGAQVLGSAAKLAKEQSAAQGVTSGFGNMAQSIGQAISGGTPGTGSGANSAVNNLTNTGATALKTAVTGGLSGGLGFAANMAKNIAKSGASTASERMQGVNHNRNFGGVMAQKMSSEAEKLKEVGGGSSDNLPPATQEDVDNALNSVSEEKRD